MGLVAAIPLSRTMMALRRELVVVTEVELILSLLN